MRELWREKNDYTKFDPEIHHINNTCGYGRFSVFIPYKRLYETLNQDELLQLIRDAKAFHWQALDLSDCGLTYLPDELWDLPDLQMLYLRSQPFEEPDKNKCLLIPRKIEKLQKLQVLDLSGSRIKFEDDIPLNIPQLIHLNILNCDFPQIPNSLLISSLKEIRFNCSDKFLSRDFLKLENLEIIDLSFSEIENLPEHMDCFKKLQKLELHCTNITALPNSMSKLRYLSNLELMFTPLAETIPPEILNQSAKEIVKYVLVQQSDAPKEYFNESKMVIVGQGHVGKSSLLNRLVWDVYEEESTTEGIDITNWHFSENGEAYKLNVWNFGGQEIYHSTHQFFLTERSLYLLVWDVLAEDEYGRIDYWLKTIQSLAGDSPIIIVVNKCDNNIGRINHLDDTDYKERFPQIKDIVYVSCKDNIGIEDLRKLIKELAINLPLMKTSWLSSWLNVRKRLEELSKTVNFISYEKYLEICKENSIDSEEALSLIKYLHDLGIVLYYYNDNLLKNIVILSSEWVTDAVYKIFDEQEKQLKGRNGILYYKDLPIIWSDKERYPLECYPYLLNLMKKFQLAFEISDSTYLVAELLENKTINLNYKFPYGETLSFRYEYDFIPAGTMTRFIVSIIHYLETIENIKQCWKKGAYLKRNTAYALVRLHDNLSEHYIDIKVSGRIPRERQELLSIIRKSFEEINGQFNQIKITEKIPCICSADCKFLFDYKILLLAESKGKQIIECHDTFEDVNIKKLLDGVEVNSENNSDNQNLIKISSLIPTTSDVVSLDNKPIKLDNEVESNTENNLELIKNPPLIPATLDTTSSDVVSFDTIMLYSAPPSRETPFNLNYEFPFRKTISFRYEYNFSPEDIMIKFISTISSINSVKHYSEKEAYLERHTAYALVRLYDNSSERYVDIKVSGEKPRDCQELLIIIRAAFEKTNSQFEKIKIAEQIPCICSPECTTLFEYKVLLSAERKGKTTIQCQRDGNLEDVNIKKLLDGVESNMENNFSNPMFINNFSPYNQNNPEFNYSPQNNVTHNPTNTSTSTSSAENTVTTTVTTTITVDIRNAINGLHGDLNYLKKKTKGNSEDFEDVSSALDELDKCETKEDIIRSGELNTIRDFLTECFNPESKTGKLIAGIKQAGNTVKNIACKYNSIAKWVGFPLVPFVGE